MDLGKEDEVLDEFDDNEEEMPVDNAALFARAEADGGSGASGSGSGSGAKTTVDGEELEEGKTYIDDGTGKLYQIPEFTRKDKTLAEVLELMQDNPPIIPDAVIDYYLTKNGFECGDLRVKRLLALATQKFVSDIAADAYEYSRIRSNVAVQNANQGQAKARQLMNGQQSQLTQQQQMQQEKNSASKVVLTVNDLSSAVAEYGLNIGRPDFYR
ncbi:hypothetical protein RNJ44_00149 [Nakaseomyces bracarensis]|uniref:Transcription initiation factor TFIID subunit 10 n=1 Tax=Nakaseomyces bracarensis TaxID=273131 RepID=A0ABR4NTF1_9SACH